MKNKSRVSKHQGNFTNKKSYEELANEHVKKIEEEADKLEERFSLITEKIKLLL